MVIVFLIVKNFLILKHGLKDNLDIKELGRSNQFKQRPMEHGTRSMYVMMKCRCKLCKDENTTYLTFYRDRKKVATSIKR